MRIPSFESARSHAVEGIARGGLTLTTNERGEYVSAVDTDGFYVGGVGMVRRVPVSRMVNGEVHHDQLPGVANALQAVWNRHVLRPGASYRVGVWVDPDDGTAWVEESEWIPGRAEALETARQRGEKAVYDIAAGETAYVQ